MQSPGLPPWTLSVRLEGATLECGLSDGRRLAWRARRPAHLLLQTPPPSAAALLGPELAARLAGSAPRPLVVLHDGDALLDGIDWEHLDLGAAYMGAHFAVARQLCSDVDTEPPAEASLADTLDAHVVHGASVQQNPPAPLLAFDALARQRVRDAAAQAHVLVLDGVPLDRLLDRLLDRVPWPRQQRLLVLAAAVTTPCLAAALDAGAAVLCLAHAGTLADAAVVSLLQHLGSGLSVGDAVRCLHRRAGPPLLARLYGDGQMRFVRPQAPASRRHVTSLSFDIVGSTAMIAAHGDEAYAEMLSDVHARCTGIVRRHGGHPDDPQGDDGVMCYFGHPLALDDAAGHAVAAALQIVGTVAELGVAVRVGVATGLVAIRAGQPVGLTVHLAARLQQAAAAGTVLVSDATRRLVAHAFELQLLRQQPALKGVAAPEPVHLVLAPRRDVREHRLERQPVLTPLLGRQAELARLHGCWQRTQGGGVQLALVSAEAGMGKSRLVRAFRHQLVAAGAKVLECRCRADASASPFTTLTEALRRWLDIGDSDTPAQALHKLAHALPTPARDGKPLAVLAAWLGIAPQPPRVAADNPRQRLLGLLGDWFQAFAGHRPCCLVVEDWHWADPSLREFVEQLLARPGGPGLLVVVTVRTDSAALPALAPAALAHIELAGLPAAVARQLVDHVCADTPLSPHLVALLAARGDGVPLFLEEAARMALELHAQGAGATGEATGGATGGTTSGTTGGTTGGASSLALEQRALAAVPASLQDLLTARLDGLGAAKQVAQVAAVLGRQFPRALLAALLSASGHTLDAAALDDRLAVLTASGLVRAESDGRFAFRHALIRDAAYTSLWTRDRRSLHAQVVQLLLQQRWSALVAVQPELLALHQTEAGLHAAALAQWELAARHAAARSAELEAISHLQRALAVLARTDAGAERDRTALRLQLLLAARLLATEGYGADAVLQAYLEAQRLCDSSGDDTARFKVEMGLHAYRFMRSDFAPALEHGRQAAAIAARSGDIKQRLHAHWGLACTLFHQGALRATMREMDTALALYTPALHPQFGVQDPGVMCMAYSSWGLWEQGRPDAALARINQAVAMAHEFEHRFSQAVALAYAVSIELLRGDTEAALLRAEACARVCEDSGFPVWLAITRCMHGYLLCERGAFDDGLRAMSAGYAQWLASGSVVSQPLYLALQAEGLLLAGRLDAAAARVDEGLAIVQRSGERQLEAELTRLRGALALRRGDAAGGEGWLKRSYVLALRQHRLGFALRSATALARHWAATGRQARAQRLLAPLAARWHEGHDTRDLRTAAALVASWQ